MPPIAEGGRSDRVPIIARATPKKGKPVLWQPEFLKVLADTCNVKAACEKAGIGRTVSYRHRDADPAFAEAWDDAVDAGVDVLAARARKRAMEGSDVLLMFLLKAHRPEMYREHYDLGKALDKREAAP